MMAVALGIRMAMLPHVTIDMEIIGGWYDYIVDHGGYRALGDSFSNYTPPFTYLLVLATYLRSYVPKMAAIKSISIVFDFVAAFVVYRLVRLKYRSGPLPWLASFAVLLAPTIAVNGALWGQSDVIYGTFLLASVWLFAIRQPLLAMASLGIAFSAKPQAAFLAPFIFVLLLKKEVSWRYTLVVPLVYLVAVLPAALLGRPLTDLLSIYVEQAALERRLTVNAPSVYALLPAPYDARASAVAPLVVAGAALGLGLLARASKVRVSRELLLKAATLSVALVPFLLPRMHDRYFFAADLLSIALAFYCPRLILVPVLFQCASGAAYLPYLLGREVIPLRYAAAGNALALVILLVAYVTALYPLRSRTEEAQPTPPGPA
jgi:Gpi18-like mannosyltransferase